MVQGVGSSTNSIQGLNEYQVYYPMYQDYLADSGENLSFEAWLQMRGYVHNFNQNLENYVEGNSSIGDGVNGNNLNINREISNGSGAIFQGEDADTFYQFDYDTGSYQILKGKEAIAKALGLSEDNPVDTINFGYQNVKITDYTFGIEDDGQDSKSYSVTGKYGNVSYTKQEFDVHYILNALLMDPSDPQYDIAKKCFEDLSKNVLQWLKPSEIEALDAIGKESGVDSAEYKDALKEILITKLDQTKEWDEEHKHVKNSGAGDLVTDNIKPDDTGSEEEVTGKAPEYSLDTALSQAGLTSQYGSNDWEGSTEWDTGNGGDKSGAKEKARQEAKEYANSVLDNLIAAMKSQIGDGLTKEMENYLYKAKTTALATDGITDFVSRTSFLDIDYRAKVKVKDLVDTFNNTFNALCVNKGKTNAEVEADKKAAEEKKNKETAAYKNLYDMDLKATSKDAGVDPDKDVQVVNVQSAADIKAKAESTIINPIKAKIKEKLAGQGIPDKDIDLILGNAASAVLSDCTSWASTSNNVVYTIDTEAVINMYQSKIKEAVNAKGYSF